MLVPSLTPLASLSLALLVPFAVGLLHHEPRNLIVGGVEAPEGRYKYTVSIKDDADSHFCGGTLISKSIVLTAAHCLTFEGNYTVAIGRYNLTNHHVGEDVTISETVLHPEYNMMLSDDHDVALVFLSRPTLADVEIVKLNADSALPAVGASVTYLGWGEIDSDMSTYNISTTLREVETRVMSNSQCELSEGIVDGTESSIASYEGLLTENMICTFSVDNKDSCQKDSGGPLILRGDDASSDIQVGVASWGISCASDVFPGVATRVSSLYDWIRETVCSKSQPSDAPSSFGCDVSNIFSDLAVTSNGQSATAENKIHVELDTSSSDQANENGHSTTADNSTHIEMDDMSDHSLSNDQTDTIEDAANGQSTTAGNKANAEMDVVPDPGTIEQSTIGMDLPDHFLPTDPTNSVEGEETHSVATGGQSTSTAAQLDIDTLASSISTDPTTTYEGDRTRSVAQNGQPTSAAVGIVMFASFACHLIMPPR